MELPVTGAKDWKPDKVGVLPPTSRVARTNVNTRNHIEQGERTWTTGQTVRDILQNHLDANTQKYFDELVETVFNVEALEAVKRLGLFRKESFDEFTYTLFVLEKHGRYMSEEARTETKNYLQAKGLGLPLKQEFYSKGLPDVNLIQEATQTIAEDPPEILYRVADQENPDAGTKWVSMAEMQQPEFCGKKQDVKPNTPVKPSDFRYQVEGIEIRDKGSGFDSKLTAFYRSTKTGKRHQRGKFGEGSKMSETHLVRNGAKIKSQSRYSLEGEEGEERERIWRHSAYVGEDQVVKQKGIEVDIPKTEGGQVGSYTYIDIRDANERFKQDFRDNVDPRIPGKGIQANCLNFSTDYIYYPLAHTSVEAIPVGVSLIQDKKYQYVQGLRVGESQYEEDGAPLYSYDFWDSSLILGRDRNQIKEEMKHEIEEFWSNTDNPYLLEDLLDTVIMRKWEKGRPPEADAVAKVLATPYGSMQAVRADNVHLSG